MTADLELALVRDFPTLFRDYRGNPRATCMAFGCEHGDGWEPLLRRACERLGALGGGTVLAQVKEKFGGLRVYIDGGSDAAHDIVAAAEEESFRICELCGDPGRVRGGGWLVTRCDGCMEPRRAD